MATTIVRKYTEPVVMTTEQIRDLAQQWLDMGRGDEDKAGDISDAAYYQGWADAMEGMLRHMIGDVLDTDPIDVWLRIPDGEEESEAEANTYMTETGYRVAWYLTSVGLVTDVEFDTLADAYDWLEREGFANYSS